MKKQILFLLIGSIAPMLHCSHLSEKSPIAPLKVSSPYEILDNPNNPSSCTSIGMQQALYKNGCRCEHPCLLVSLAGGAGDIAAIGMFAGSTCGSLSVAAGYTTAFCLGVPSVLITGFAACEARKRCTSNNTDQLDYITDSKNWPKKPADDHNSNIYDFGYDSGYDS